MERISLKPGKIAWVAKALLLAYLLSGVLLLLMALAVYKLEWEEQIVSAGVIVVYVLANLAGGLYAGKKFGKRRFLAGMICGILYAILLSAISFIIYRDAGENAGNTVILLMICGGSGMVGGMIS